MTPETISSSITRAMSSAFVDSVGTAPVCQMHPDSRSWIRKCSKSVLARSYSAV
jgi:hypothetical protein